MRQCSSIIKLYISCNRKCYSLKPKTTKIKQLIFFVVVSHCLVSMNSIWLHLQTFLTLSYFLFYCSYLHKINFVFIINIVFKKMNIEEYVNTSTLSIHFEIVFCIICHKNLQDLNEKGVIFFIKLLIFILWLVL